MKILLIDHHELFREGLRHVLQSFPGGVAQILETGNFTVGLKLAEQRPDLILLELNSPQCRGAYSIGTLRQRFPLIPVVVVSSEEAPGVINQALSSGASGYVCKSSSSSTLFHALNLALTDSVYVPMQFLQRSGFADDKSIFLRSRQRLSKAGSVLTKRQSQVLSFLIEGRSNKAISTVINLAEGTVKVHVSSLFQVLRVNNRIAAVQVAKQMGLA